MASVQEISLPASIPPPTSDESDHAVLEAATGPLPSAAEQGTGFRATVDEVLCSEAVRFASWQLLLASDSAGGNSGLETNVELERRSDDKVVAGLGNAKAGEDVDGEWASSVGLFNAALARRGDIQRARSSTSEDRVWREGSSGDVDGGVVECGGWKVNDGGRYRLERLVVLVDAVEVVCWRGFSVTVGRRWVFSSEEVSWVGLGWRDSCVLG